MLSLLLCVCSFPSSRHTLLCTSSLLSEFSALVGRKIAADAQAIWRACGLLLPPTSYFPSLNDCTASFLFEGFIKIIFIAITFFQEYTLKTVHIIRIQVQ